MTADSDNGARRFAYSYTCRTLSIASFSTLATDAMEGSAAIAMFQQLTPFLLENSTLVLGDIGEAVEYVLSREKQDVRCAVSIPLIYTDYPR